MDILFTLIGGTLASTSDLISRKTLKQVASDHWAFSFYFSLVGAIVNFPFMLADFKVGQTLAAWLLMLVIAVVIVLNNYLFFKAVSLIPASLVGVIGKFRLVWVLVLGALFLNEPLTGGKVIGVALVFCAALLLVRNTKELEFKTGAWYAFIYNFLSAVLIALFKLTLTDFSVSTFTFLIFALPAIINFCLIPNATLRITALARTQGKWVFISCAFGAFANLAINSALNIGQAGQVTVILESFLAFTLIAEILILKEKSNIYTKVIAVILAIAAGILVSL